MVRGALFALAFVVTPASADVITKAEYSAPTQRYDHGILGDSTEYGALVLTMFSGKKMRLTLPEDHVFEDIAPRLVDVDNDGAPEVVVIETDMHKGAALAIYDASGKVAETPHIGRTHRWLAPIGGADLDGDGLVELAYIDRPHLARVLTIWRFQDGALHPVATREGLTNHSIGQDYISGGIRDCGDGPEMITATSDWSQIAASTLVGGRIESHVLGPNSGANSFSNTMNCRD
ncbi:FG-GAP repeat domain-containing protein [Falsihalocynthiibacter arcticus]|uniref:VCBS repeat-containing protein n=1 Tax=Falsihalocynthiibacter arcticus TaxID=1579316 RepID=A0A126UWW8_9RHOB|nr:VCBS repeat-containing protein [Falsihalocynthiibacter arcticus]AML49929.1 hypothetical protein RC74_00305 [Falsihalocynthiibacter arcticus]